MTMGNERQHCPALLVSDGPVIFVFGLSFDPLDFDEATIPTVVLFC